MSRLLRAARPIAIISRQDQHLLGRIVGLRSYQPPLYRYTNTYIQDTYSQQHRDIKYRTFASSSSSSSSTSTSSTSTSTSHPSSEYILISIHDKVALLTLNRPKALNALNADLMRQLNASLLSVSSDPNIGAIVITGSERAFAAGADIKEMKDQSYMSAYNVDMLSSWHQITLIKKPIIAAVNGYALGGGCELALMCDIIYAGDKATFGQPEVVIGTIPGCGGSQRLTRTIGKSKAMEMILSGQPILAQEALDIGLISKIIPAADLVKEAIKLGNIIANHSQPIVSLAKESVNAAYETTLHQGVIFERRLFHSTFATEDQKEGMAAFTEKRKPTFNNR